MARPYTSTKPLS
jgi:hypothetical protein